MMMIIIIICRIIVPATILVFSKHVLVGRQLVKNPDRHRRLTALLGLAHFVSCRLRVDRRCKLAASITNDRRRFHNLRLLSRFFYTGTK